MSFEKKTLLHTVRRALSLCALLTIYPIPSQFEGLGKTCID
jgi:hypothetical protein